MGKRDRITELMTEYGIWQHMNNGKLYTPKDLIEEHGNRMPEQLKKLLMDHVEKIKKYLGEGTFNMK